MYYKLPVKDRMDLMKSYKKANKDMSYHDMVKDYNDSYAKYDNGGKLPFFKKESDKIIVQEKMLSNLKPIDFVKEKANYEEQTRGASQADGTGISSTEMAWRASKLADPTFVSNAAEVIKDAYMGNEQNLLNLTGAIPIPYLSGASKLARNVRKYYMIDKVGDITNKVQDILQK